DCVSDLGGCCSRGGGGVGKRRALELGGGGHAFCLRPRYPGALRRAAGVELRHRGEGLHLQLEEVAASRPGRWSLRPRLLRNQRRTLVRRRERQGPVGLCSGGSGAGHGRAENAGGSLRAALARWDPVLRGSPLREDGPGVGVRGWGSAPRGGWFDAAGGWGAGYRCVRCRCGREDYRRLGLSPTLRGSRVGIKPGAAYVNGAAPGFLAVRAPFSLKLAGFEGHRDAVDAVAKIGGGVVPLTLEDVTQVAVAGRAENLYATHAEAS